MDDIDEPVTAILLVQMFRSRAPPHRNKSCRTMINCTVLLKFADEVSEVCQNTQISYKLSEKK